MRVVGLCAMAMCSGNSSRVGPDLTASRSPVFAGMSQQCFVHAIMMYLIMHSTYVSHSLRRPPRVCLSLRSRVCGMWHFVALHWSCSSGCQPTAESTSVIPLAAVILPPFVSLILLIRAAQKEQHLTPRNSGCLMDISEINCRLPSTRHEAVFDSCLTGMPIFRFK